jgi:hypothetical protein
MILIWISSCDFEFEKNNNKQSLKIDSCTQKKTWYVKCNKTITALHFVQYNVLWSTEKQYWLFTTKWAFKLFISYMSYVSMETHEWVNIMSQQNITRFEQYRVLLPLPLEFPVHDCNLFSLFKWLNLSNPQNEVLFVLLSASN